MMKMGKAGRIKITFLLVLLIQLQLQANTDETIETSEIPQTICYKVEKNNNQNITKGLFKLGITTGLCALIALWPKLKFKDRLEYDYYHEERAPNYELIGAVALTGGLSSLNDLGFPYVDTLTSEIPIGYTVLKVANSDAFQKFLEDLPGGTYYSAESARSNFLRPELSISQSSFIRGIHALILYKLIKFGIRKLAGSGTVRMEKQS